MEQNCSRQQLRSFHVLINEGLQILAASIVRDRSGTTTSTPALRVVRFYNIKENYVNS